MTDTSNGDYYCTQNDCLPSWQADTTAGSTKCVKCSYGSRPFISDKECTISTGYQTCKHCGFFTFHAMMQVTQWTRLIVELVFQIM